jgi:hypothetical protein
LVITHEEENVSSLNGILTNEVPTSDVILSEATEGSAVEGPAPKVRGLAQQDEAVSDKQDQRVPHFRAPVSGAKVGKQEPNPVETGVPHTAPERSEGEGWESRTAHGSGRSIPGFHLLNAIETCHDLFTRFGGHAHAVGFSLPSSRVPELRRRLEAYALANLSEDALGSPLTIHAAVPLDRITPALFTWLRRLHPCGMGNEEPVFLAQNVRIASAPRYIKDRHVRLQLAQGPRAITFPAIGWHWAERAQTMNLQQDSVIHLAYKLRENEHPEFGGLELEICDIEIAH